MPHLVLASRFRCISAIPVIMDARSIVPSSISFCRLPALSDSTCTVALSATTLALRVCFSPLTIWMRPASGACARKHVVPFNTCCGSSAANIPGCSGLRGGGGGGSDWPRTGVCDCACAHAGACVCDCARTWVSRRAVTVEKITVGNVNGSVFRHSNGWLPLGLSCLVVVIVALTRRLVLEGFPVIWQIREMTPLRQLPLISLSVIGPSLIRP